MAYTAQEPLTECKVLLNDPSGTIYPDDKVLPLMQKAYRELQTRMMLHSLPVLKESVAAVPVAAGVTQLSDGAGLPDNLVYPTELAERASGTSALYSPMTETFWEKEAKPGTSLNFWSWREEEVKFLGATTPREVKIRFMRGFPRITAVGSPILVNNAVTFLAARTAALAALTLGANPQRAGALGADAAGALDELIGILAKRQQGIGVRRGVNRYRR
jgi:hypothetical protein